jgi:outer membrane receptor protein involved in Fe transport
MFARRLLGSTCVAAILCGAAFGVPLAHAQDLQAAPVPAAERPTAKGPDDIVVTGSRIRRPSTDNAQPTAVIDERLIENRGYTSVSDAINQLPGFGIADSSAIGDQGNGLGVGQAFVNLYDLGSQRTLTLVNGRRFVGANPASIFSQAGGGSQVDLNTIPTKLIQRVDVVSIGGAPIYGADAIAGTVNIVLKRDFEGIDLDAQAGISQQGDLANQRVRGLFGKNFANGRGNITFNIEYAHDDGLLGNQRDVIRQQYGFIAPLDPDSPFQQVLIRDQRTFLGAPGGNPYFIDRGTIGPSRSVVDAAGNYLRFGRDGNLVPFNTGTPTNDPTTFIGGDSLNFANITNLRVRSDRFNATGLFNYELTDGVRAFAEGWYSRNTATNLAGQPVYNTAFFRSAAPGDFDVNGNFIVKLGNPFLTSQAREIIRQNLIDNGLPATDDDVFYLGRANTDLVSGVSSLKQDLFRVVGGLTGEFNAFDNRFIWEVSGNYGRTTSVSSIPTLVEPNLRRALNVGRDASGNIVCLPFNPDPADPTAPPNMPAYAGTISQTCAPLNLFGEGAPSQAARDYVTTIAKTRAITTQRDVLATVTGSLFDLPGGKLGVSLGYENRREYSKFDPDAFNRQALGRSIPILGVSGSYTTNEVFGEIRAPLIGPSQEIPLVNEFEVNAAGRYVHNSINGGAFTWTAGGRWSVIPGLAIRGNYTRAIRAPSVTELFVANQPAFDGGYDPCDQTNLNSGPNPAVRQKNCAAAGLPSDFNSLINSVTVPINVIGNRDLRNETARSWTIGAVVEPRFLRGFSLAADYVSVDLADTIVSSSAKNVLEGCYDASNYPDNFYCGLITRETSAGENFGQVLTLDAPFINQGGRTFRAVEATLGYRTQLGKLGRLSIDATYQHIIKSYTLISAEVGPSQNRGGIGNNVDRANVSATLESGAITWFNQLLYIGPAVFDPSEAPGTRDVMGIGGYVTWNTGVVLRVKENFDFRINVNNVTNRGIPYPASGSDSQNLYNDGLIGRSFLVGAGVHF